MMKLTPLARVLTLGLGCVGLAAQAQQADAKKEEPIKLERVEITGSNIKRVNAETAVPVQVITRSEIDAKGFTTVKALLDNLSTATGGLSDIRGGNSFSSGSSAISMRNMGSGSTLVLLNGRRLAPYGFANFSTQFTNIDSLPFEAIERVEVLKTGASAIYGSDAVAGVINFITRKDYKGGNLKVSTSDSFHSHEFGEQNASLTYGFGDLASQRFNVLANLAVYHRDPLFYGDIMQHADERLTRYSATYGTPSSFSYPGNISTKDAKGSPTLTALGSCALMDGPLCMYDRYSRFQAVPKSDRVNGMLSGRYELSADTQLFAELTFSRTKTQYESAFPTYGGPTTTPSKWLDASTGTVKQFNYILLPGSHPLSQSFNNGDASELRYRFVDALNNTKTQATEYRGMVGAKGVMGEWDWESALAQMASKAEQTSRGAFSDSGFKAVIGDYNNPGADFFNKAGGYQIGKPNSAAVLNQLFPEYGYEGSIKQTAVDFKASRNFGRLPGGPMAVAVGADLRREEAVLTPTQNLLQGDIVGNGLSTANASRNFGAVFTEFSLPVLKELEVQAAARLDKFPGFGTHISPKLAIRYQPTGSLLLRGTLESGFRAPNLSESAPSTKASYQSGLDPLRCTAARALRDDLNAQAKAETNTAAAALLRARAQQVSSAECSASFAVLTESNPDLKPETSRSLSVGIVFEPIKALSMSADFWKIERKDEISRRGLAWYLQREGTSEVLAGEINRGNLANDTTFSPAEQAKYGVTAGQLQFVRDKFRNTSRTRTSGLDFEVTARANTSYGKIRAVVNGTYLDSYREAGADGEYAANMAGFRGLPRMKSNLTVSMETARWTHSLQFAFTSETKLASSTGDTAWSVAGCAKNYGIPAGECKIADHTNVNAYTSFRYNKRLSVGLNVTNVFNNSPSADLRGFLVTGSGVTPQDYGLAQGRGYRATLNYNF